MKLIRPFEETSRKTTTLVLLGWYIFLLGYWVISSSIGTTHIFPTPSQVGTGFSDLYQMGLVTHIFSSLWLCVRAVFISLAVALIFCYLSPLPIFNPVPKFVSLLRYLPLTGISFYIGIMYQDARTIQILVLVVFMTTYLITSILAMIKDIVPEEFDHARTLGCNRWEMLWEVVIKGRIDYVVEMLRQNLAIVWMMIVTVESILPSAGGIGYLIKNNDKNGDSGKVIALQIIIVLIGVLLEFISVKSRKLTWRYSKF